MIGKILLWECEYCKFDQNWSEEDSLSNKKILICQECGVGVQPETPKKIRSDQNGNWLCCLPLTDISARLPAGNPPGCWMEPDMKNKDGISRERFLEIYNVDALRNWCHRHPNMKRPESIKIVPPPKDASSMEITELSVLKDMLKNNRISQSECKIKSDAIAEYFKLKKDGLIPEEEYKKRVKEVMDM
jgi:hypothetical protein